MKAVISQGIDTALSRYFWLPLFFYEQHFYFNNKYEQITNRIYTSL